MRPIRFIASAPSITQWFGVDDYVAAGVGIGLFVTTSGAVTGTGSFEVTPDDIYNTAITPVAYAADAAGLTSFTGTARGAQTTPVKAIRGNFSGTGSWIMTIVQQGAL